MKYLLLTGLILVVYGLWRHKREAERNGNAADQPRHRPKATPGRPAIDATPVVACDLCGLHLPRSEALLSHKGIFCSDAHRRQAESA